VPSTINVIEPTIEPTPIPTSPQGDNALELNDEKFFEFR
jgi:hypothetical protein